VKKRSPLVRVRLHGSDFRTLRQMAKAANWSERGGRAIREAGDYQTGGQVIGRTVWVGMPEWAQGFGWDSAMIKAIVEKAIAGKPLGEKQRRLIASMLHEIGGREPCPF
jgi:hypothetical protein